MVVGDVVASNARLFPNKVGIVDEKERLTWKQLNERVNRLVNALLGVGLKKGDRAAIVAENCHEYAEFLFAVAKAGLITVCLNYRLTPEQMNRIMNDCEPRAVLIQDKFNQLIEPIKSSVKSIERVIGIGEQHEGDYDYETLLSQYPPSEPNVEIQEQDTFRLQYTTGTTGTRKGAMLTHKNEVTSCIMRLQASPAFRDDIVLHTAPLFAVGTQTRFFGGCFLGATSVVTTFSARGWVETVERERVTYASLLPATTFKMVREYLEASERKYDLSSLRKFQPEGGQHCSGADLKAMLDYFNIPYSNVCKPYGMTEAMPAAYLVPEDVAAGFRPNAADSQRRRLESVGKPLFNGEMRVVDDNDHDVPLGQTGEIILRGGQVMKGYWNNPELTARALKGGWFHTSDLGVLDEDGYLYFRGRKDFVIKSGGLLVGPEEVEDVIQQLPAVAEVAVIGLPDNKWGQVVTAVDLLLGKQEAGENVVVIGGGSIGCETALHLAQEGKMLTIVEQLDEIARDMCGPNRMHLLQLLKDEKVNILTETDVLEIKGEGVLVLDRSGQRHMIPADTVVLAVGMRGSDELAETLRDRVPEVYVIGDCAGPGKVRDAIWAGFRIARLI